MSKMTELGAVEMWLLRRIWSLVSGGILAGVGGGGTYLVSQYAPVPPDAVAWTHPGNLLYYGLFSVPIILSGLVVFGSIRLWRSQNFVRQRSYEDIEAGVAWLNDTREDGASLFGIEGLSDRSISRVDAAAAYDAEVERREEAAWQSLDAAVDWINERLEEGEPPFVIEGQADRSIPYANAVAAYYAEVERMGARNLP